MAIGQTERLDYLLKKIGYTNSKTGIAVDSSLSGTKKAPFAESIPSPLVLPGKNVWSQSNEISTTPPTSNTSVVGVYTGATALLLTEDNTVSNKRAFLARSTPGNNSSSMLSDWVDTQFGSDYIVKIYVGNPPTAGVTTQLSAGGSGNNDEWFFDYSSGVLNFIDTNVPTLVGAGNSVWLVGYRYIGEKGVFSSGDDLSVGILTATSISVTDAYISGILTATDINSASDIRLKTNIKPFENTLEKIVQINGVSFNWIENNVKSGGIIAQDVEKVFPELVNDGDHKTVNYNGLIGVLVESIKELKQEIEDLKSSISLA